MNRAWIASAVILMMFPWVTASATDQQPQVVEHIRTFLESYQAGNFTRAAEQLYCPDAYSPEKRRQKQQQLSRELAHVSQDYGKIRRYAVGDETLYTAVVFACGPTEDYAELEQVGMELIRVDYQSGKRGVIQLFYLSVAGEPVLGMVGIGDAEISIPTVRDNLGRYRELKEKFQ